MDRPPTQDPQPPQASPSRNRADLLLGVPVALGLFAMMLLTFIDVIGRYLFNAPLQGGYELTELCLAFIVFGALPLVTATQTHVTTALFEERIRGRHRHLRDACVSLAGIVACGVIAWRLWVAAGQMLALHTTSQVLRIPTAPLVYFMAVMTGVAAAILAWQTMQAAQRFVEHG